MACKNSGILCPQFIDDMTFYIVRATTLSVLMQSVWWGGGGGGRRSGTPSTMTF